MENNSSPVPNPPPTFIRRNLGNSSPTDVGRGSIRLTKSDAEFLGAKFNDILEIKTQTGAIGYAKCLFIHPDDETTYSDKVQLDSIIERALFGMYSGGLPRPRVEISKKAGNIALATSVILEPFLTEGGMPPEIEKIDTYWLSAMIEDKPLWKGALIVVPITGAMSLFQVRSVEPPVAIGTMVTKVALGESMGEGEESKPSITSELFGYNLLIQFKRRAPEYDTLSKVLEGRGFTVSEGPKMTGLWVPRGMDPDLMRHPSIGQVGSVKSLLRGTMMIRPSPESSGNSLTIEHFREGNKQFVRSEEFIDDFDQGLPLFQGALEKEFHLDFTRDVESMSLDAFYAVKTSRDSRAVLKSLSRLPDSPELGRLIGHKDGSEGLFLYAATSDRSLVPKGLIQVTIHSVNVINMKSGYDVRFKYGLENLSSASRLIHSSVSKAASIVEALEQTVS